MDCWLDGMFLLFNGCVLVLLSFTFCPLKIKFHAVVCMYGIIPFTSMSNIKSIAGLFFVWLKIVPEVYKSDAIVKCYSFTRGHVSSNNRYLLEMGTR
jgi:hypothetical protein